MRYLAVIALAVLALCSALGQNGKRGKHAAAQANAPDGARLFAVNCGRCHRPPDQLSPKISGSVLRHMRVRAVLSQEDERAILKYLAP